MDSLEQTLDRFRSDLELALPGELHDVIIHGSVALGDFAPNCGDIDYVVLTETDMSSSAFARLVALHDGYRKTSELLLNQLEGTFYPRRFLSALTGAFTGGYIGTTRAGWRLISTLQNSLMDLLIAGSRGRSLFHRALEIFRPTHAQLRAEIVHTLGGMREQLLGLNGDSYGFLVSVAHWAARALSYLQTQETLSKSVACRRASVAIGCEESGRLLGIAERERFPYRVEAAESWMKVAARDLLRRVSDVLGSPDNAGL